MTGRCKPDAQQRERHGGLAYPALVARRGRKYARCDTHRASVRRRWHPDGTELCMSAMHGARMHEQVRGLTCGTAATTLAPLTHQ